MIRTGIRLAAFLLALNAAPAALLAQRLPAALDTMSLSSEARAVYRVWHAYLASKRGQYSANANTPSPYWSAAEQQQWPVYDLAGYYLADQAIPRVRRITRVPGSNDYRIVTHFRAADTMSKAPPDWWTSMTVTVYATREAGTWRLGNALPRHTRAWRRDTVGPITYVVPPGYRYRRARAEQAVTFTDSLARAFGVPRLAPLTYFLLPSIDAVYASMGLESALKFGATGGAAQPTNRQLFSGIPSQGEAYRHELVHLVLAPLVTDRTQYFVSEGIATWLGGTTGMDFPTAARGLAALLADRPHVGLESMMAGGTPMAQRYPAGAVLVLMAFEHGGTPAVRTLFNAGSGDMFRTSLEQLFGRSWQDITIAWRARVMRFAGHPPKPRTTY